MSRLNDSAVAILVACVTLAAPLWAAAEPLVIESYAGARPQDADRWIGTLRDELASSGYPRPAAVGRVIEKSVSASAGHLPEQAALLAMNIIDSGFRMFVSGRIDQATAELDRGLEQFRRNPSAIIGNAPQRDAVMRGQLGLALSLRRQGRQTEATSAMAELVRSFPDKEISYKDYGPEPREFFEQVRGDLGRQGQGAIAIQIDGEQNSVFVNERYAGVGSMTVRNLLPGRYRILVKSGERFSRVHRLDVEPGETPSISISLAEDQLLQTDEAPHLSVPDEASRKIGEARSSLRLARAVGAQSVVVLGLRENGGRRSVVGAVYSVESGRPLRSGAVAIDPTPPSATKLRALARLLAGDEDAAKLVTPLVDEPIVDHRADRPPTTRPFRTWKWLTLGAGLTAAAAGVTLFVLDDSDRSMGEERQPEARETRTAGIITGSVGAALIGVGIYMFMRDRRDQHDGASTISARPESGGASVVWTGRF